MDKNKLLSALATTVFINTFAHAGAVNMGAPESGVELGLGWDSQRAEIIPNRCIRFAPVKEEGQTIRMKLEEVSDSSELMEKLKVSAGMSIKSAVGSASAQGSFASNTKVTSSSNSLLIRATVDNGVLFVGPSKPLDPVRSAFPLKEHSDARPPWWIRSDQVSPMIQLTEEALDLLGSASASELREFERYCGDSFVSAIYSGAEVLAVMSFKTKSRSQAKTAHACVKASASAWGVKGEAKACADSATNQNSGSTEVTVEYTQIGGAGGKIPMDREGFISKLNQLPSEAQVGPQFHSIDLLAYSDLPNWPHSVVMNTQDDPEEALLVNFYYTLGSVQRTIQDALDNEALYLAVEKDQLQTFQDQVIEQRRQIHQTLQQIHALAGLPTEVAVFFGLFSRTDEAAVAKQRQLEEQIQARKQALLDFNGGSENPNLIKLKLPLPCVAVEPCEAASCEVTGQRLVDYYVGDQARRICQSDPTSNECLNNKQLEQLAKQTASLAMDQKQCKLES